MGAQKTPKTYKKASQNQLEKTSKKCPFSEPKNVCKISRGAAIKLRLRRRPPTKDDPQKENHTRTNATFLRNPITPGRLRPGADFWMHFGVIVHPFQSPKCIQKGVRNRKRVLLILSVSSTRQLNSGFVGSPESIKMTSENRLEN